MFFRRTRHLDCPQWMRDEIVEEINQQLITSTGMDDRSALLAMGSLNDILAKINALPDSQRPSNEHIEYFKSIYNTTNITGWEPTANLRKKIYDHYNSFLKMVPDKPKIIIKRIMSETDKFNLHCDKLQTSSLTCLIRGEGPVTLWYEPLPEFEHKFRSPPGTRHMNRKGLNSYPPETQLITSIRMRPWEMIFFDHNAVHQVENLVLGMERILFSIGFLNITETELEDIYDRWWTQNN